MAGGGEEYALCLGGFLLRALSCLFLFVSSLSGLGLNMSGREEDGSGRRAVDGRAGGLKWPGEGKNTHSVLEDLFSVPMCIWRPNRRELSIPPLRPLWPLDAHWHGEEILQDRVRILPRPRPLQTSCPTVHGSSARPILFSPAHVQTKTRERRNKKEETR